MKRLTYQIIKKGDGTFYVQIINNILNIAGGIPDSNRHSYEEAMKFLVKHKEQVALDIERNRETIVYTE